MAAALTVAVVLFLLPSSEASDLGGRMMRGGTLEAQPLLGQPLNGLTGQQKQLFDHGRALYDQDILVADGLGPIHNQTKCGKCHVNPLGGSGPTKNIHFYFIDGLGNFDPLTDLGGTLLQKLSIDQGCREVIPPEANQTIQRVTNGALGYGLIEAIPDAALDALEQNPPPGVSGRVQWVKALEDPNGPLRAGRFGWKAHQATVLSFSADAATNELGFTNRLLPDENAPNGDQQALEQCDSVADPEDGPDGQGFHFIDRVTHFQRYLAAPPQTPRSGMTGEGLFDQIGCTACHVASFVTADDPNLEDVLRNQVIRPYGDFLLHDMGELGDGIEVEQATGGEFRTAPLWGLRARAVLLHDGRAAGATFADRIDEAVAQHQLPGSEALESARQYFEDLTQEERDAIIAFLDSLGRGEFDHDGDDDRDLADFLAFRGCHTGPGQFYTPDDACAISDVDQDGDVDLDDLDVLITVYEGRMGDCNNNAVNDLIDIVSGTSADDNDNGLPDECETVNQPPDTFTVVLGRYVSGGVTELALSDDEYLEIAQMPALSVLFPLIQIELTGTASAETASEFGFTLEASASANPPNVPQRLHFFNFQSGTWQQVDGRLATQTDSVVTVTITDMPDRFIEPGTMQVRTRINWWDPGDVVSPNWGVKLDQAVWNVLP